MAAGLGIRTGRPITRHGGSGVATHRHGDRSQQGKVLTIIGKATPNP